MIFALFYVVHFTPGCTVFHREAKRRHKLEPVAGFEPATSSLPRKCSTPELHRQNLNLERKTRLKLATLSLEGWCSINWATSAFCGQGQIRTAEAVRQQIYSLPVLTTYLPTQNFRASCRIRTNDPEITNHVLWPTELKRQLLVLSERKATHYVWITK